LFILAW